uniref:Uncharacterized protein n=1 Tax=Arundo donax TaxID=35708 RepID=A0A0A9BB25_ARUDO
MLFFSGISSHDWLTDCVWAFATTFPIKLASILMMY